jgi:hypothetical protein
LAKNVTNKDNLKIPPNKLELFANHPWLKIIGIVVTILIPILIYFIKLELRVSSVEKGLENYEIDMLRKKDIIIADLDKRYNSKVFQDSISSSIKRELGLNHKMFFGKTEPGATNWRPTIQEVWLDNELRRIPCIYLDIDLSGYDLGLAPTIYWSLYGNKNHFEVKGTNAIYGLNSDGFRIYLNYRNGITPAQANSWGWYVKWIAVEE